MLDTSILLLFVDFKVELSNQFVADWVKIIQFMNDIG